MYNGRYQAQQPQRPQRRRKRRSRKTGTLLFSLVLLLTMMIGGTLAYLTMKTDPIQNRFTPSQVSCTVTEDFNGTVKKNVNVTNDSDIEAYIRVKLVSYRVNNDTEPKRIGGTATIPEFNPGTNWFKYGDYYYYTLPVAPGQEPAYDLIGNPGISLTESYDDADGGKQVIEVMAEAIQSSPASAVGQSWGVTISQGSVQPYTA